MSLEEVWNRFIERLTQHHAIDYADRKDITGIPFVYLKADKSRIQKKEADDWMKRKAADVMRAKRLNFEMTFVREDEDTYVYRARFLVPQRKMFCCGNLCVDCIRFEDR